MADQIKRRQSRHLRPAGSLRASSASRSPALYSVDLLVSRDLRDGAGARGRRSPSWSRCRSASCSTAAGASAATARARTTRLKVKFLAVQLLGFLLNRLHLGPDRAASRTDLVAADRRRSSSRRWRPSCSTGSGFSADGADRLRADGRARPAPLVVPRAARGACRADRAGRRDLPKRARILEIGCGTGHNLAMLGRFGRVDALELDEEARGIAEKRLGRPVMQRAAARDRRTSRTAPTI